MIVTKRAPGLGRSFAAEQFPQLPVSLWTAARQEAESRILHDSKFEAYASDIDEDILDITYENALRAGVEQHIKIFAADARSIKREDRRGTVVCNPPYGERMGEREEVERLYQQLGGAFRGLDPWQIYVLTSSDRFDRLFGRRADKIKKLYNGTIPCYLYEYFKPAEARVANAPTAKDLFDRRNGDRRPQDGRHTEHRDNRRRDGARADHGGGSRPPRADHPGRSPYFEKKKNK